MGKIRYLGFSNVPAWATAQAQTLAELRAWTPLIALQVEYSLLARTVEGEIAPLAADRGLALVPWSPLRNGFLSGKYQRGRPGHRLGPVGPCGRPQRGRLRGHRRGGRGRR
ncbi:MAG TPA: aldo/keto reductase [Streptosporangiaceae bacterium]|jgi:aryl-alcohol dehydrogenase (NADP+)